MAKFKRDDIWFAQLTGPDLEPVRNVETAKLMINNSGGAHRYVEVVDSENGCYHVTIDDEGLVDDLLQDGILRSEVGSDPAYGELTIERGGVM